MALREYNLKRDFQKTPEPAGKQKKKSGASRIFVVQKHAASHLHYDFRLELNGVLKSWAIPKGPSLNPEEKHLAIHVEDHPFEYKNFEGIIPAGEYGGGTVLLWDQGTWTPEGDPEKDYRRGKLKFQLHGKKLKGSWVLFQMKGQAGAGGKNWLLVKERDAQANIRVDILKKSPLSVTTGRSLEKIAADQDKIWTSSSAHKSPHLSKNLQLSLTPPKAHRGALPDFIPPQLATLSRDAPQGEDWLHEIKFDGYRIIARLENGKVRLYTRNENDWTDRFSAIVQTLKELPVEKALLDGEIVKLMPDGVSNFQALQNALSEGKTGGLHYYVFDLLYWNGLNLMETPLESRRVLLEKILPPGNQGILRFSQSIAGHPKEFYREACRQALEGVVSKQRDSRYESGRSRSWLKVKCVKRQEFVLLGFTDPAGKRTGFGSLILGLYDSKKKLHYTGLVGTGFSQASLKELHGKLLKLEVDSPTVNLPAGLRLRKVHWVRPKLVAEVDFTEWTRDGVLRHPSFEGLREDKSPFEVLREEPKSDFSRERRKAMKKENAVEAVTDAEASSESESPKDIIEGVHLSHPNKILYPDQGITKQGLAEYYQEVADFILPHLTDRPLSLLRCPAGAEKKCFYQKHIAEGSAGDLETIEIKEKEGAKALYVMANDLGGLITLVQMGVLEIHPWGARAQDLEHPDRMIFDLDPDPSVPWKAVVEGAKLLRLFLLELKLHSFVKLTGGKGLHVEVPLSGKEGWREVKDFSKAVVLMIVNEDPSHYTHNMLKAKRGGKIFLDYLRNERGATAVAPYSTRARPEAPVSVPLFWEELDVKMKSDHFNVKNLPRRLSTLKKDPWEGFFKIRQSIPATAQKKVGMK